MVEERLKVYILSKYRSVREFTTEKNIPYSTVATIFNRGITKANIENVIKICDSLNISIDELVRHEAIVEISNAQAAFTPHEKDLIQKYRQIDDRGKQNVEAILENEYQNYLAGESKKDVQNLA